MTRHLTLVRDPAPPVESEPAVAGPNVHREVCLTAPAGGSWADRCRCGEPRARHANAEHKPIQVGPGAVCSGRNLAGACRNAGCSCTRFRLAAREAS
jgi:hypothetical protein